MVELGWTEADIANTSVQGLRKVYAYMSHKAEAEKRLAKARNKKNVQGPRNTGHP